MRILIIEDDQLLANVIARELNAQQISTEIALDGEQGVYKAVNWKYDLILLDVMLPKLDGWEVLTKIRKSSAIPIIMLTAKGGINDRVAGLELGADDYLCKPFNMKELIARIKALKRRSAGALDNCIKIKNVEINIDTHSVFLNGNPVSVTLREYELLELLAQQRGKVVSKQSIIDHLDPDSNITHASLDVHLCNLRRKFDKDLIKTVRGKGYLIEV